MSKTSFELKNIKKLTNDVYFLEFESEKMLDFVSWQFITFLLPKTWFARAYSVYKKQNNSYFFIIKKLLDWRWWSKEICELKIWDKIFWVWPVWHFVLKNNSNSKLFIWTWTWIVPLYAMSSEFVENNMTWNIFLLNWNKTKNDLYEINSLQELKDKNPNFDYKIYLSREESEFEKWYVTSFLNLENISKFSEFYICWNPKMVEDVVEKLRNYWIDNSNIFTEKY